MTSSKEGAPVHCSDPPPAGGLPHLPGGNPCRHPVDGGGEEHAPRLRHHGPQVREGTFVAKLTVQGRGAASQAAGSCLQAMELLLLPGIDKLLMETKDTWLLRNSCLD